MYLQKSDDLCGCSKIVLLTRLRPTKYRIVPALHNRVHYNLGNPESFLMSLENWGDIISDGQLILIYVSGFLKSIQGPSRGCRECKHTDGSETCSLYYFMHPQIYKSSAGTVYISTKRIIMLFHKMFHPIAYSNTRVQAVQWFYLLLSVGGHLYIT